MKKKKRTSSVGFIILVLSICSQFSTSCTSSKNIDKIFLKELDHLVTAMQSGNEAESRVSLRQIELFSKKYLHSKYSDDAKFIVVIMNLAGQWKPELVRDFLVQYPMDKLEDETLMRLEQITGPDIYLPYETYFLLPEALYDAQRKDFKSAVEKNKKVLQAIDSGRNSKLQKLQPSILRLISLYDAQLNKKQN